jgi:hypothetical protein
LPEGTEKLDRGVPKGCGVEPPEVEPPCISGGFGDAGGLTVDPELSRLFVVDRPGSAGGRARIDGFEDSGGFGFVAPQIDEEGGVSGFTNLLAVGRVGAESQVYVVADRESKEVVAVYGAGSGRLLGSWVGTNTPNGSFTERAGRFVGSLEAGIAVDRSKNPVSEGDVYVETREERPGAPEYSVVDVFTGKPTGIIGEEPQVVATLTGTCPVEGTACSGKEVVPFHAPEGLAVSGFDGEVFVTDLRPGGPVVDVFEPRANGVSVEYMFVRQLLGTPEGRFGRLSSVSVDGQSGDVYVADEFAHVVDEFEQDGKYVGQLAGTSSTARFGVVKGVAVNHAGQNVFVADDDAVSGAGSVDVFGPNLVIPDVETKPVGGVRFGWEGTIEATLNGTVDPLGAGEAACWFTLGQTEAFGSVANCSKPIENINTEVPVEVPLEGLAPDQEYVFRLQASNRNGTNPGERRQDQRFVTPGPGIHSESVSDVTSTSATLHTSIDPNNAPTSFYIQYIAAASTAGCDTSPESCATASAPLGGSLGSGKGDVAAQVHVQSLTPGTVYHYRMLAVSQLEVKPGRTEPVTFVGADKSFTTLRSSVGPPLLDGRQWEQVTPIDKHGALILPIGAEPASLTASSSGSAVSYALTGASERGVSGVDESVQVLSDRMRSGGWTSKDIAVAHAKAIGATTGLGQDYRAFSADLCVAVVEPLGPFTSLNPEVFPPDSERTPYLRHNCSCPEEPSHCYEPLLTGVPGYSDVPEGTKFGGLEGGSNPNLHGEASFIDATPDMSHVLLASSLQLTSTPTSGRELYNWSASRPVTERLQLVSVLEDGRPAAGGATLGFEFTSGGVIAKNAVSSDGSRVFWTEEGGGLYLRDMSREYSLRVDKVQGGMGTGVVSPVFQAASSDGSRVFFTDQQRLTADSGAQANSADLYACNIVEEAGGLRCVLEDLTPSTGGESATVQGTLGASEDGSWIYVVADGVLGETVREGSRPGDCQPGGGLSGTGCNLYALHNNGSGWEPPRLVGLLSTQDYSDWGGGGLAEAELTKVTSRVSPNGEWLAFMSMRSLTGYDNRDALSGVPDQEVFLYHAGGASGKLICASCNPSGALPVGEEYAKFKNGPLGGDGQMWHPNQWFAATLPGWTPYNNGKALYQSRYLSNSGRLFFNSHNSLLARDINDIWDVYELEPTGVGNCTSESPAYVNTTESCLSLVSSGRAAGESAFIDASETGDDVFFLTGAKLVPGDTDTALDLYDAHVCSETAPCSSEPVPSPACVTIDSCRQASTPQPSVFGTPASATFGGEGNLQPASGERASARAKRVALSRAQKLARALKACRRVHGMRKRAVCERRARARYGTVGSPKGSARRREKGG